MEANQIIIYQNKDGETGIDVKLENDTVWLTQNQLVELFQSSKANISEHVKHVFESGELDKLSTVRKFRTVGKEGDRSVTRKIVLVTLDSTELRLNIFLDLLKKMR